MKAKEFLNSLYEMSNLTKDETGIPFTIFVSAKGGAKHQCRIKVSQSRGKMTVEDSVSVTVTDSPVFIGKHKFDTRTVNDIKTFIKKNKSVLLAYWNSTISTAVMIKSISSVKE